MKTGDSGSLNGWSEILDFHGGGGGGGGGECMMFTPLLSGK